MLVQRANVVLDITPEEVNTYVQRGFNVLSDDGMSIVTKAVPTDVNALQKAYKEHEKEIESLHSTIKELEAKLSKVAVTPVEDTKTTESKPKQTKKKTTPKESTEE